MKTYEYTYDSLAKAAGKTIGSLRVDISRKLVDPADLRSVSAYVAGNMLRDEIKKEKRYEI